MSTPEDERAKGIAELDALARERHAGISIVIDASGEMHEGVSLPRLAGARRSPPRPAPQGGGRPPRGTADPSDEEREKTLDELAEDEADEEGEPDEPAPGSVRCGATHPDGDVCLAEAGHTSRHFGGNIGWWD